VTRHLLLGILLSGLLAVVVWRAPQVQRLNVTPALVSATLPWVAVVGALRGAEGTLVEWGPPWATSGVLVYVSVALVVLTLWKATASSIERRRIWYTVSSAAVSLIGIATLVGLAHEPAWTTIAWEAIAILLALVITGLVSLVVSSSERGAPTVALSVVFGHVLDATTTAVGLGVLGATEQNPVSRWIIETGDQFVVPGVGLLLFLAIKLFVSVVLVAVVREDSTAVSMHGTVVLVVAAGAGLVPAVHNLFVFATLTP